jgi:hypothetical protein
MFLNSIGLLLKVLVDGQKFSDSGVRDTRRGQALT